MRRTYAAGASALAIVSIVSAVGRADQSGRTRDVLALAGERVEVAATFDSVAAGRDATILIDRQVVGTARTDANGWVRLSVTAPRAPGLHALRFVLGGAEANATLDVLDPARPTVLVDLDVLWNKPDAATSIAILARTHQVVYFHDGSSGPSDRSASRAGLPAGGYAKLRENSLAPWLRGLAARGVRFTSGLARTSSQALAMQSVGIDARVAPASLTAAANEIEASRLAALARGSRGAGELEGSWQVVDPSGARTGEVSLTGAGPSYRAVRNASISGVARHAGDDLDVTYTSPVSTGFRGAMNSANGAGAVLATAHYVRDPVEGAFVGAHEGTRESLRRASGGNAVDILVDGAEMLPAYVSAIRSARRSIHIESYIWRDEVAGNAITNALCERLDAGVQVRAIMDGIGSNKASPLRDRITSHGGQVVTYNPISFSNIGAFFKTIGDAFKVLTGLGSARDPSSGGIDNRDHRNVLVIDGSVGYTGGIGFADDDIYEWHDLHARVQGPAVAQLQRHFEDVWTAGGGGALREDPAVIYPAIAPAGPLALDVLTTVPGVRAEVKRAYLSRVATARREILIQNPYFTDDELIASLKAKARSGVPVTIILPVDDHNDVKMVGAYHARIRPDLWAAGVRLLDYPKMTHGKVAII
ncbi:MAG: phosphatidylserine/phosphatidylglycerophosphate/cardiolipin synthase family protein, partial [Planctomycetota bacterium]